MQTYPFILIVYAQAGSDLLSFTVQLSSLKATFSLRKKVRLHVPAYRKGLLFFCKHKINSSNSKLAFFQKKYHGLPSRWLAVFRK